MGCMGSQYSSLGLDNGVPFSDQDTKFNNLFNKKKNIKKLTKPDFFTSAPSSSCDLQQLWTAIRMDNVSQLARFIDEKSNAQQSVLFMDSEIGIPDTWWSVPMYCCRWNASQCLKFSLKIIFKMGKEKYLKCMDVINSEHNDILHVIGIYKAKECGYEIVNYGGPRILVKNKFGNTAAYVCLGNGLLELATILKSSKEQRLPLMQDNLRTEYIANLSESKISQIIRKNELEFEKKKKEKQLVLQNLMKDFEKKKKQHLNFQEQKQKILMEKEELKRRAEEEENKIYQELEEKDSQLKRIRTRLQEQKKVNLEKIQKLKQEAQNVINQAEEKKRAQEAEIAIELENKGKKLKEEAKKKEREEKEKFQAQISKKTQEMSQYRKKMNDKKQKFKRQVQESEKIKKEKEEEIRKTREEAEKKKMEFEERKKLQEEEIARIEQQKQDIIKRKQQQLRNKMLKQKQNLQIIKKTQEEKLIKKKNQQVQKWAAIDINKFSTEAQEQLKKHIQNKTKFTDPQFPPSKQSLSKDKLTVEMQNAIWVRPNEIFDTYDYKLFDKISPEDIKQGGLGVCYYLATLSSLAQKPKRIKDIFLCDVNQVGLYIIRLYINGKYKVIKIDDFIPVMQGTDQPLFSNYASKQIWCMLLEKAWAKNFGCYTNAQGMSPDTMIQDVTGSPSYGYWTKEFSQDQLFEKFIEFDKKQYINVLTSNPQEQNPGIVASHAYSALSVYNYNGIKLIKIRNPWGSFEWEGEFGDKSNRWTQELKQYCKMEDKNDGIFFMTPKQLKRCFSYFSIGFCKDNYIYSQHQFQSAKQENVFFTFIIRNKSQVNIRIIQKFKRYILNDPNYNYSPLQFQLYSINKQQMVCEGDKRCFWGNKTIHASEDIYLELEGQYMIRIKINWVNPDRYNSAVLVGYSMNTIEFTKMSEIQGNIYQQAFQLYKKILIKELDKEPHNYIVPNSIYYCTKWFKGFLGFLVGNDDGKTTDVSFKFNAKKFQNCKLGMGTNGQQAVIVSVNRGEKRMFAIDKIDIKKATSPGQYGIQIKQKQGI